LRDRFFNATAGHFAGSHGKLILEQGVKASDLPTYPEVT